QLSAGPYAEAADFFAARGDPESTARAALARERNGDFAVARALADRVVAELKGKRLHSIEALARGARARAAVKLGAKAQAVTDLRWLALEDALASADADVHLAALAPERALTKEERLGRALTLGRAGAVERTELELDRLAKAPGAPLAPARLDRARAFAYYYARSDYKKASELFTRAARGPGVDSVECTFYAARSLARAQDDERAVRGYRELKSRYPRSSFADQAGYLVARTHYAGGRFADAARAYDGYLGEFSRGKSRDDALYERAVSWLALGKNGPAAAAFESLAKTERDARRTARLHHLEGVARAAAGDTARARALFSDVAASQPLGFSALASAERLAALEGVAPALLPAGTLAGPVSPLGVALPESANVLHALGLDRDAELELTRSETALKQRFGARSGEGLCSTYGLLDVAARRFQIAQTEVLARTLASAPSAANRWQWECVYPRPYADAVIDAARDADIPSALLYAVMRQESAFRPDVVSGAGARGLMQLLPSTAEKLAQELGEPFDPAALGEPAVSLRLSARYLKKLLDAFGGNVALAAAGYNAGPQALRRWLEGGKGLSLDVFVARIPYGETLEYVERVVGNYARYRYLEAGPTAVPRLALELPAPSPPSGPEY
ncbi:MAG TPA: transglycosylase SLT domain-containing protein, partial [Polyangiaceae bacterium]|nr:transglycosylase SLT domain-containing protein [Polyangiaceae bacterium]